MGEFTGEMNLAGSYGELVDLLRMAKLYRNGRYSPTVKAFAAEIARQHTLVGGEFAFDARIFNLRISNDQAIPYSLILWFLGRVLDVESKRDPDAAIAALHSRIAALVYRKGELT